MKSTLLALAVAVAATTSVMAADLTLPAPGGSSILAGWIPTNAEIVEGELQYTGPWLPAWSGGSSLAPSVSSGSGTWALTTTYTGSNFTGADAFYIFTPSSVSINTADYNGAALGKISLQLATNAAANVTTPTLTIGSFTFTAAEASLSVDTAYLGDIDDPTNRYAGHYGNFNLLTFEWDLAALGVTGSTPNIGFTWNNAAHTVLYDAQVNAEAIPEPGTTVFLAAASLLMGMQVIRRRRKVAMATLVIGSVISVSTLQAVIIESGFQAANPSLAYGAQLSGFGAISPSFGEIDAPNRGFIAWEKFSSGSFSEMGHQYSGDSGILSGTLNQDNEDVSLATTGSNPGYENIGGTDYYGRLAAGGGQSYSFSLAAVASTEISRVTLAIKHSPFMDADFNPIMAFTASLNGVDADSAVLATTASNFSDPLTMNMTTMTYVYSWDISILAGENFTLSFASGPEQLGMGFSVDSIGLGVQAIPEPSSVVLIAGGVGAAIFARLRRNARKS